MNRIFRLLNKSDETERLIDWWANLEGEGEGGMSLCGNYWDYLATSPTKWAAEDHSEVITLE